METQKSQVITRMPPSPTGLLHVGNVRTLLFNYLYAKKHGGKIVFRSEDTDKVRSRREYEEINLDDLAWLGLSWDEFHRQSERAPIYRGYLERLIDKDLAYLSTEESRQNEGEMVSVVRLRNPNQVITFTDEIRGEITFDTTELGDIVIARSLDDALYHFTVVVDDHEMNVTHIIRGEDHISNTPRQILIQEALGFERPIYAHLPILLGTDRSKLSKRHGSVSLHEYRTQGFLPQAINNYLALLGWNPGTNQEVFTLQELIEQFDLAGVQKSAAIFDIEKMKWLNREHLLRIDDESFFDMAFDRLSERIYDLPQFSQQRLKKLIPVIRERVSVASEITEEAKKGEYDFAFTAPKVPAEMLKWKNDASVRDALPRLQKLAEIISQIPEGIDAEEIKSYIWSYAEEVGKGEVLWPLRVALTGKERSPDPFTVIAIIGSPEAFKRIQSACDTILHTGEHPTT